MTVYITNVENHTEIKNYILEQISVNDFTNEVRPVSINLDNEKINQWYGPAIERFRLHRITTEDTPTIFDPMLIWINVYPPGTSMNSHRHPDYHFYSIHYVQKTELHSHTQTSNDGINWQDPDAAEGDILFFGGDTYHQVLENTTDVYRITVGMSASSKELADLRLNELRLARNELLNQTDWWLMSDINSSQERLKYRQDLRDITLKYNSLQNVIWPIKPL